jgi:hypothetical protein
MRRSSVVLFALLWLARPAPAADDPKALVEKAVQALGGADLLSQHASLHARYKGKSVNPGAPDAGDAFTFEGDIYSQKGRRKMTWKMDGLGAKMEMVLVTAGDKSWISYNGNVQDVPAELRESYEQNEYTDRVASLLPLLKDKEFTLTALGESKVEGRAVLGLKVTCKGKPDVSLFFDKATGLLARSAMRIKQPGLDGEIPQEIAYSDYREPDDGAEAEKAVKAAGLATDAAALLKHLRDQAPDPRRAEKVQALIKQLGDDSFAVREKASEDLIAVGKPALPLLREAAKDKDLEVARRAEDCLQKIGQQSETATAAAVVRLLAARRPEGVVEALLDYLPAADEAAAVEVKAALVLLAQKDGKPHPALVKALEDKDLLRRRAAEGVLGKDGGKFLDLPGRRLTFRGLKMPMKSVYYQNEKKTAEVEVVSVEFFNRFEDKLYARP